MSAANMSATTQQQQGQHRPRSNTHFSFRSDKSADAQTYKSKQSKHDRKVSDSERRKTHYDPNTKANPNAAMEEAQPIAAALEKPTLQSLRSFNHTDVNGNPIAEPDLSNPTRSRWERPLDTIRAFEAAIDGEYKRRSQAVRADQSDMNGYASRRSSYYGGGGGGGGGYDQNRYSRASYYGHQQRDTHYENGYGMGGPVGGQQRMRYGSRMQSDPGWHNKQNGHGVYPIHGLQQSRDTVNTNGSNGSHSDGPYSNDPSSDNSSFERPMPVQRPPQPDVGEQYGFHGFGKGPQLDPYGKGPSGGDGYFPNQGQNGMHNGAPPPPPKHASPPGGPIKLNPSATSPNADGGRPNVLSKNNNDDKRKSWFKRRFSKD